MILQVFHHAKSPESLGEHSAQLFVRDRELFVFRVIEIALLDDGPHALHDLRSRHFVLAHDSGQLGGEAAVLGENGSLSRHVEMSGEFELVLRQSL